MLEKEAQGQPKIEEPKKDHAKKETHHDHQKTLKMLEKESNQHKEQSKPIAEQKKVESKKEDTKKIIEPKKEESKKKEEVITYPVEKKSIVTGKQIGRAHV